jgi:AbrB family looped-hinge helix DNA binding protein
MKTTIDADGRLVVPKEIRRQAGLRPGMLLDIHWRDGRIEIELVTVPVALVQEGRFMVAVPRGEGPVLTSQEVEETRGTLAYEHERGL